MREKTRKAASREEKLKLQFESKEVPGDTVAGEDRRGKKCLGVHEGGRGPI